MHWESIARARKILEQERGSLTRDWGGLTPVALAYPNTYHVAMSSLGFQTLYRLLNDTTRLVCERVFQAFKDSRSSVAKPLLSLESQRRMEEFATLAFSLSFETDYLNMIDMLRRASIPPLVEERDETYPLLIAGGPAVSANPEPLAPIMDAIVIGEVEETLRSVSEVLAQGMETDKDQLLTALTQIPGVYVPQLHTEAAAVQRQWVREIDACSAHTVVLTPNTEFSDMYLIEIARGCRRGCRFCLAGFIYRPMRERSLEALLNQAHEGLRFTDRIGLVASSVSDYSRIDELATRLRQMGARLSVSSLRADSLSTPLLKALSESGTRTLTIAPEAGSERLRRMINKGLSADDILSAAEAARQFGFAQIKLYFMIGLPTETEDDIADIITLVEETARRFKRKVTIKLTPFVPKAHTPFEREAMTDPRTLQARARTIEKGLRPTGVTVSSESVEWARVQGTLARGDRRLGYALASLDGLTLASWRRALKRTSLNPQEYLRSQAPDEKLPWRVTDAGIDGRYLEREARQADSERTTLPCPPDYTTCNRCGVCNPTCSSLLERESAPARAVPKRIP